MNLIVARFAKTEIKELEITVTRFEQAGSKVHGVILNDIQRTSGSSAYNYSYAYTAHKDLD